MRKLTIIILLAILPSVCEAFEWSLAFYRQELGATWLVGYKRGEHLVLSHIEDLREHTPRFMLDVKVSQWGKAFTSSHEFTREEKKYVQTLTVTLHETSDQGVMKAEFKHSVTEDGKLFLSFSGTTFLSRSDIYNT